MLTIPSTDGSPYLIKSQADAKHLKAGHAEISNSTSTAKRARDPPSRKGRKKQAPLDLKQSFYSDAMKTIDEATIKVVERNPDVINQCITMCLSFILKGQIEIHEKGKEKKLQTWPKVPGCAHAHRAHRLCFK